MAVPIEIPKTKPMARSLPLELWPKADQHAWAIACQPPGDLSAEVPPVISSRSLVTTMLITMATFLVFLTDAACSATTDQGRRT